MYFLRIFYVIGEPCQEYIGTLRSKVIFMNERYIQYAHLYFVNKFRLIYFRSCGFSSRAGRRHGNVRFHSSLWERRRPDGKGVQVGQPKPGGRQLISDDDVADVTRAQDVRVVNLQTIDTKYWKKSECGGRRLDTLNSFEPFVQERYRVRK